LGDLCPGIGDGDLMGAGSEVNDGLGGAGLDAQGFGFPNSEAGKIGDGAEFVRAGGDFWIEEQGDIVGRGDDAQWLGGGGACVQREVLAAEVVAAAEPLGEGVV